MTPAVLPAGTTWADLLPAHRADEAAPRGAPVLLDTLPLGTGAVLAVVGDHSKGRTPVGRSSVLPVPLLVGRRAGPGDGVAAALVELLHRQGDGSARHGAFTVTAFGAEAIGTGERAFGVDQTNESTVVGERAVVKWMVPAPPGPHPAPSLLRELVGHGFTGMPRPWGLVEWSAPGGSGLDAEPRLLAVVDALVPEAQDGWTWAVDDLRRSTTDPGGSALAAASGGALGTLVGELHAALASTAVEATGADAEQWAAAARGDLDRALAATTGEVRAGLLAQRAHLTTLMARTSPQPGSPLVRVHGDLHVGQVLRAASGAGRLVLTDFDGNPVVPPAQRCAPQPAALDVAGLVQSAVHAGIVLRRHHPEVDATAVTANVRSLTDALLTAYRASAAGSLLDEALLPGLRLRQVLREFAYAGAHLPRWSYVPEAALPALLSQT